MQCGEVGHIARNCPKGGAPYGGGGGGGYQSGGYGGGGGFGGGQKTCYSCGGIGHMSRMSPSQISVSAHMLTKSVGDCVNGNKCYNCGVSGHLSRDCPKESGTGEKICYKCQQTGHVQSQCPNV